MSNVEEIKKECMIDKTKLAKIEKLRKMKANPYPYSFHQTHHSAEIISKFDELQGKPASVAGRIMTIRHMGKLTFFDLLDSSGKIQIMVKADTAGKQALELLDLVDRGDIIGVTGNVTKSTRGEISVELKELTVLAKALREMPEKFHGLSDVEIRYRKRYLDLASNPSSRQAFVTRAKIITYIRDFLDGHGYLEVETPALQPVYGGATAKPFKTHHNSLNADLFLRISDELYLKRLIIGGLEKVYEISKDFRNEDIDSTHNPEFTMLEAYEAYGDYSTYMKLFEEMLSGLVKQLSGSHEIEFRDKKISFKPPFKKLGFVEEIKKKSGIDVADIKDDAEAERIAKKEKLETHVKNRYHVADALFDKYVKPELWDPTFVMDYPAYMCPLVKDHRKDPRKSERFEMFAGGEELMNVYSELTDPQEQRRKFEEQVAERKKGDEEMPPMDEDFVEAMEYGMPPTAGIGIGIDRLVMLFTNNISIKEVILFPSVKPESKE